MNKRYRTSQYQNISGGPSLGIGTGQHAIGTFTADASTQVITMGADSAGILSAIQVRDVTPGLDGKMPPVSGKTVTFKVSSDSPIPARRGKFEVTGWNRADPSATWNITAAEAAPHEIFVLVQSSST